MVSRNLALLVLLPTIYANIEVDIFGSRVYAGGDQRAPISDAERSIFNLTDENLKESIRKNFGEKPDDVYLRAPTPWHDLYSTYNWPEVKTVHKPLSHRVLPINTTSTKLPGISYNNTGTDAKNYTVNVNETLNVSFKLQRENISNFRNYSIGYNIFIDSPQSDKKWITYNAPCCQTYEKNQKVTISSESDITLLLLPGQTASTEILVDKNTLKIELNYETTLLGTATANYNKKYKGHHFWSLGIQSLLDSGHLPKARISKETLEYVYYTNPRYIIQEIINGTANTDTKPLNIEYHG